MATIREFLTERYKSYHVDRLARLKEMNAPKVVIESTCEKVKYYEDGGVFRCQDKEGLLDKEFTVTTGHKGNGGKQFILFLCGDLLCVFFPQARYGAFIRSVEKEHHDHLQELMLKEVMKRG